MPRIETKFGKDITDILKDHPILWQLWDEKIKLFVGKLSDKDIIESIVEDFEYA